MGYRGRDTMTELPHGSSGSARRRGASPAPAGGEGGAPGPPPPTPFETEELALRELRATIQHKQSPAAQALGAFLRAPATTQHITGKADDRTNIIDQNARVTYALPPEAEESLADLLERGRKEGVANHFSERQGTPAAPACGIMLDFDLVVPGRDTRAAERDLHRIALRVAAALHRDLVFPPEALRRGEATVHVFTTLKAAPTPLPGGGFKYGFHFLVPGVWVSRGYKKYLVRELRQDPAVAGVLAALGARGDPGACLDPGSASVPVLFLGSCKRGGHPYGLGPAFEVAFEAAPPGGRGDFFPIIRVLGPEDLAPYNLVAELALCSEARRPGGALVRAHLCEYRPELAAQVEDLASRTRDGLLPPDELLLAEHALSTLALRDPEARYLHQILDLLDPSYASEREKWRNVIFALANTSESYRPLAEWFSHKCPAKWADGGRETLDQLWADAVSRRGGHAAPLTRRSLLSWAKDCNAERFRQVSEQSYFSLLTRYVYDYGGALEHYMVAKVLHAMLSEKFVVDVDEGRHGRYTYCWFEFVIPGQASCPGEVWKWRKEVEPDELQTYLSESLVRVFDQVAEHLEKERAGAEGEERGGYYKKLGGAFLLSRRKIFNDTFKNGVLRQAGYLFRRRGFAEALDQDPTLIGLGNGVLRLGPLCELISHFHEYPIMRFTPVCLRPFSPADPWTRLMLDAIADIAPEADFRDWLLFFAASSLAGGVKEGLLLLWNGGGANGKTFFMRMVAKTLGRHYARKLNISLLTSERESADRPNSAVMQLKGCRWGYVEETQKAEPLNSQRLKEIVNPGEISGRDLNQKQENFEVTANLAVGQNYPFLVDTTDHGTWRRLRFYMSKVTFCPFPSPDDPYEKQEDQRFVRDYINDPNCQAAFLSILVHYYQRLQREHGGELKRVPCPTLDRGTQTFRNGQDTLHRFITETVATSPGLGLEYSLSAVATRYTEWYGVNIGRRHHVVSEIMTDLENSALQRHIRRAPNKTLVLVGVRLLSDDTRALAAGETYFGVDEPAAPAPAVLAPAAPSRPDWWAAAVARAAPTPPDLDGDFVFVDDALFVEPGAARRAAARAAAEAPGSPRGEPPPDGFPRFPPEDVFSDPGAEEGAPSCSAGGAPGSEEGESDGELGDADAPAPC